MVAATVSSGSRRFTLAGLGFLLAWQVATLLGASRPTAVFLGVFGFVLHVVFGKAYALVPTYFARDLSAPWAPRVHLPLASLGVVGLALGSALGAPTLLRVGAGLWAAGVALFLAVLVATIRTNPAGRETATGGTEGHRRGVDRAANAAVPAVLAYLLFGTLALLGFVGLLDGLPPVLAGGLPAVAHLHAAGVAAALLFAVGFRVLPRFLATSPPRALVGLVLPAGAVGPALIVAGFREPRLLLAGALLESLAVVGFAVASAWMVRASDRSRVGFRAVLAGVGSGVGGVALGLGFALGWLPAGSDLVAAHLRLNVLGFLGLSIVGVLFQFSPPAVGRFPGSDDRVAARGIDLLAGGLWVEVLGLVVRSDPVARVGTLLGLGGALVVAYLHGSVVARQRHRRRERERERA